jgi:hypothetical protein
MCRSGETSLTAVWEVLLLRWSEAWQHLRGGKLAVGFGIKKEIRDMKMNKLLELCVMGTLVAVMLAVYPASGYGQEASTPNYVNVLKGYEIKGKIVLQEPGGVSSNVAVGYGAMVNTSASTNTNTAVGFDALFNNTTGGGNTAIGYAAGNTTNIPTTGSNNTFVGAGSGPSNLTTLNNAAAIGACAQVSASNALVLGALAGASICNSSSNTNVGIDVGSPSNILTVLQGGGPAIADGWDVYSSRRWKTHIQPLQNALGKVEQLRGVSYDLEKSGKHQIGVIAEEVGEVVPEVVSYEENGKDARGVDYSRLTALLIEATKEQQQEIQELRSELRATREALQNVQAQVATAQPALVAAK